VPQVRFLNLGLGVFLQTAQLALRRHSGAVSIDFIVATKKKVSLEKTAQELTDMVEKFLSSLPPEEQNRRVDNFQKAAVKLYRSKRVRFPPPSTPEP